MNFREYITEAREAREVGIKGDIDKYIKDLKKIKTIKSAKVNHDGTIDIETKGDITAWETDGTGKAIDKLGLFMYHAYNGLSGNTWELREK